MAEQLRIGIIGTSNYAQRVFLSKLSSHRDVQLAALCGRDRTRTETVAATYQIPTVYTDYQEMIRSGKLDAVIVAAPDDQHYPMTMSALKAGLHVLCEKPMAMNSSQAAEMLNAAERSGVKHMVEFTWRWMPHYQYVHHLVSEGYIGHQYHCHFQFLGKFGRGNAYAWRFDPTRSNGTLADSGSHMIDMALWLCGDANSVDAHLASFSQRVNPEGTSFVGANETAVLTLDFAGGAQGIIHVSNVSHTASRGMEQYVSLHGEAGRIEVEWKLLGKAEQGVIVRGGRQNEENLRVLEVPEAFLRGTSSGDIDAVFHQHLIGPNLFVDAILHDYMPTPNFHQGVKVQQVVDAAIESHSTGRRVSLHR